MIEILLIALTIYFEAGNQPIKGQQAVANVILNRCQHYGKSPPEIIFQPLQFSCYNDKKYINKHFKKLTADKFKIALQATVKAMQKDCTKGALFYDVLKNGNGKIRVKRLVKTVKIGNHNFYKIKG